MYNKRLQHYLNQYRSYNMSFLLRGLLIILGALLVAFSLQFFLVKNHVIDGGIVGISILISHIFSLKIGSVLLVLNTPFLFIGHHYLGKRFLVLSMFAIFVLCMATNSLESYKSLTNNPFVVVIFGGFLLGLGVGIIIRFGGCLDGTEVIAIILSERSSFSIGQFVMVFNFFILGSSLFVFGIKEALYSLATYFIAYNTIDFSLKIFK